VKILKTWTHAGNNHFHLFESIPAAVGCLFDNKDEKHYKMVEVSSDFLQKERMKIFEEKQEKKEKEGKASELKQMIRLIKKYPYEVAAHLQLD